MTSNCYAQELTATPVRTRSIHRVLLGLCPLSFCCGVRTAACINETLYNLDTGDVICYNEPYVPPCR